MITRIWQKFLPKPQDIATAELKLSELELLKVETQIEEWECMKAMLTTRISRLRMRSGSVTEGN